MTDPKLLAQMMAGQAKGGPDPQTALLLGAIAQEAMRPRDVDDLEAFLKENPAALRALEMALMGLPPGDQGLMPLLGQLAAAPSIPPEPQAAAPSEPQSEAGLPAGMALPQGR